MQSIDFLCELSVTGQPKLISFTTPDSKPCGAIRTVCPITGRVYHYLPALRRLAGEEVGRSVGNDHSLLARCGVASVH